jgi:hypothetical protein
MMDDGWQSPPAPRAMSPLQTSKLGRTGFAVTTLAFGTLAQRDARVSYSRGPK